MFFTKNTNETNFHKQNSITHIHIRTQTISNINNNRLCALQNSSLKTYKMKHKPTLRNLISHIGIT